MDTSGKLNPKMGKTRDNFISASREGRVVLGDPEGEDVRTLPVAFFNDMYLQPGANRSGSDMGEYSRHVRGSYSPNRQGMRDKIRNPNVDRNAAGFMQKRYGLKEGQRHAQIAKLREVNNQLEMSSPQPSSANISVGDGGLMQLLNSGQISANDDLSSVLTRGNSVMHQKAKIKYMDHSLVPGTRRAVGRLVNVPLSSMDNSMLKLDSEAIRHRSRVTHQEPTEQFPKKMYPRKGLSMGIHANASNAVALNIQNPLSETSSPVPSKYSRRDGFSPERSIRSPTASLMQDSSTKETAGMPWNEKDKRKDAEEDGAPPPTDMRVEVDKIRNYLELLDTYSLHHFIVWKGKTLDQTPEYASFQRTYRNTWGPIKHVILLLEKLLQDHAVPLAIVDGKAITELAMFDIEKIHREDLFGCIANIEQIRPELAQRSRFQSKMRAQKLAATVIQSVIRMFVQRRKYKRLKVEKYAVIILQAHIRCWVAKTQIKRAHAAKVERQKHEWEALKEDLRVNWYSWQDQDRIIIHIPSITIEEHLRMGFQPNFQLMQNLQMNRLCALVDPKVQLIYVSPYPLYPDSLEYLKSVLGAGNVNGDNLYARLHVVVPENADVFSPLIPLSSLLYYSPNCLGRIKNLVRNRPAFIVPSRSGYQEQKIALELGVPLLAPEISVVDSLSACSIMKRLFAASEMAIPVGAHDIYDEEDFIIALTKLIASNLMIRRWIFKIDADYSNMGVAYFDVQFLECIVDLRKQCQQLVDMHKGDRGIWNHPDVQLVARAKILKGLKHVLANRARVCFPQVYSDWNFYVRQFTRFGGVIEAEPSYVIGNPAANLFISPVGEVSLVSTQDVLFDGMYQKMCAFSPQISAPHAAIKGASMAIAENLFLKGVIGYVTVQFLAYWEHSARDVRLWAISSELHLTNLAAAHKLFVLLCPRGAGCKKRKISLGAYSVDNPEIQEQYSVQRSNSGLFDTSSDIMHYGVFDYIFNPCLSSLQHGAFFKLCRLQGISFDLQTRLGVVFLLPDSFAGGVLSFMQISETRGDAMKKASDTLQFLRENIGVPVSEIDPKPIGTMTEVIRTLYAAIEKSKTVMQIVKASKVKVAGSVLALGSRHTSLSRSSREQIFGSAPQTPLSAMTGGSIGSPVARGSFKSFV